MTVQQLWPVRRRGGDVATRPVAACVCPQWRVAAVAPVVGQGETHVECGDCLAVTDRVGKIMYLRQSYHFEPHKIVVRRCGSGWSHATYCGGL